MIDSVEAANAAIREASPALHEALSPLGRRALFPQDIPFQAAQARGRRYNGTIGQITDGRGGALALPSLSAALSGLPDEARNRALLYSPVEGIPELRRLWGEWQRRFGVGDGPALATLPVVTAGLTHSLAVAADLFGGEGRAVAVPRPFWGNYRQAFGLRTGARMVSEPAYGEDGRWEPRAIERALTGAGLAPGEPAVAIVNVPSNPGGYSPTAEEREELGASLVRVAEERPLVVLCDDAYAGLVFEEDIPARSLFWDLQGRHPNLVPVKVDGVTKELAFFGGRVGFLTFPFEPGSAAEAALESKVKCMVRAGIGSPVAASQVVALQALLSGNAEAEVEAVRQILAGRHRVLQEALAGCDPGLIRPLPVNSGCFALLVLGSAAREAGLTADRVRRHLLEAWDTGLVAVGEEHLRIAHCSVSEEDLPELVRRLERGVEELARG
ncbi:MAG TPA: aminotransferase class I/II-fold pyridoxal phosphate-dependent enzyme [Thermoanaerobaculia bacterium]